VPLKEKIGAPAFAELRAHFNRLTASPELIPFIEAASDKMLATGSLQ
jgi:hypothetical protein